MYISGSHLEDCISFEKQHTYAKLLSSVLLFSSSFRSEVHCANLQYGNMGSQVSTGGVQSYIHLVLS